VTEKEHAKAIVKRHLREYDRWTIQIKTEKLDEMLEGLADMLERERQAARMEALEEAALVADDSAGGFKMDGLDGYAYAANKVAARIRSLGVAKETGK
jgi:hypothetical protein